MCVSASSFIDDAASQTSQEEQPMDYLSKAVFRKVPEGYIAWVPDLPGANTQGVPIEEARASLAEAIQLVLDANRDLGDRPPLT